jgi:hypothetical protein
MSRNWMRHDAQGCEGLRGDAYAREASRNRRLGVDRARSRVEDVSMSIERCDVVVVGAGVMGSASARSLQWLGDRWQCSRKFELGHHFGGSHGGTRLIRGAVDDWQYTEEVESARRM